MLQTFFEFVPPQYCCGMVFCDFHSSLQNRPSWGAAAVLKSFSRLFRLWRIRRERLQKRRRAGPSTKVFYFALVPLSIMSKVDAINFQHGKQILSFFSPSKLISCSIAKLKAGEQRCLFFASWWKQRLSNLLFNASKTRLSGLAMMAELLFWKKKALCTSTSSLFCIHRVMQIGVKCKYKSLKQSGRPRRHKKRTGLSYYYNDKVVGLFLCKSSRFFP